MNSQIIIQYGKERLEVKINRKTRDIQRIEGEIHKRTGVNSTIFRFKK